MPPKKISPKKTKKVSPEKGSPGKKKGVPSDEPPVDVSSQTEISTLCLHCFRSFRTVADLQSHILLMDHFYFDDPLFLRCKSCCTKLHVKESEMHHCAVNKMVFLDQVLGSTTILQGLPIACLLCRGRNFHSKSDLICHIMCTHSVSKKEGHCGQCTFNYEEPPEQELLPNGELDLPEYNEEWDKHILNKHAFGFSLWFRVNVLQDSSLRFPYTCTICGYKAKTNSHFQAHIIYRHATSQPFEESLFVCTLCNIPFICSNAINGHIQSCHSMELKKLAIKWMKEAHIGNQLSLAHTCIICWTQFEYDFHLQAHFLVCHGKTRSPYICGWCNRDFSAWGSLSRIHRTFRRHELEHMNELHRRAIEFGITTDAVPELAPLNYDDEEEPEIKQDQLDKKGKNAKKGSPKKNSPEKKDKKKGKK